MSPLPILAVLFLFAGSGDSGYSVILPASPNSVVTIITLDDKADHTYVEIKHRYPRPEITSDDYSSWQYKCSEGTFRLRAVGNTYEEMKNMTPREGPFVKYVKGTAAYSLAQEICPGSDLE